MTSAPIEYIYDLAALSNAGDEVVILAAAEQARKLADWLGVESVEKFQATVTLKRLSVNRYRYDAALACDLTQNSVVTLEPLRKRIEEAFSREIHVARRTRFKDEMAEELTLAAGDDDAPEEVESPDYDLAAPLLEELSLALDPYPRAEDEVFRPPETGGDPSESPFAILKKLRDGN